VATGHCKNPDSGRSTSFRRVIHAVQQIRIDLVARLRPDGTRMAIDPAFSGGYVKPLHSETADEDVGRNVSEALKGPPDDLPCGRCRDSTPRYCLQSVRDPTQRSEISSISAPCGDRD
jgi:hypothetical protein